MVDERQRIPSSFRLYIRYSCCHRAVFLTGLDPLVSANEGTVQNCPSTRSKVPGEPVEAVKSPALNPRLSSETFTPTFGVAPLAMLPTNKCLLSVKLLVTVGGVVSGWAWAALVGTRKSGGFGKRARARREDGTGCWPVPEARPRLKPDAVTAFARVISSTGWLAWPAARAALPPGVRPIIPGSPRPIVFLGDVRRSLSQNLTRVANRIAEFPPMNEFPARPTRGGSG